MDKAGFQPCPQCLHQNEPQAHSCELCEWPLTQSTEVTQAPTTAEAITQRATDLTVDPNATTQEFIDPNLTVAPEVLAAEKSQAKRQQSFQLAGDLAHFEVLDVLGQGGMGMVYHAKDKILGRDVALKMLRPVAANNHNTEALLDEARMASKLNHPNIVTIYDVARAENSNYIVMEWVDGKSLDELIPEEGLPLTTAIAYACQIAEGLSSAHQKYIIHRDIKPQNIMLSEQNTLKILDFGIAGLVEHMADTSAPENSTDITNNKTTPSAGTPSYMSPEQAQGLNLDQRSDIFSFGLVLYQMLTGKRAFVGNNATNVKQAICQGDYTPAQVHQPELPQNVLQLLDKMLATAKDQRWQSSAELSSALNEIHHELTYSKNWWQRQHGITRVAVLLPFILGLGWSVKDILFPASTQQLIEQQLSEATKVAILPFDNISGDPTLQLFGDGLAVNLSTDLTKVASEIGDSWIVPSTEISRMKEVTPKAVADKYGVELILTGSMQHMGSTRLVVLNLLDAQSGQQLKTTELNIDADDLFAGHASIRAKTMELLDWPMSESLTALFDAERPELDGAYKHYIEGRGHLYRFDQAGNADKALTAFQQAIEMESNYENAIVGLAEVQLRKFHKTGEPNWLDNMASTINKLKAVNPINTNINFLSAELAMKKGQYDEAVSLYESSINSNADHVLAKIGLAKALTKLGSTDQAEKLYQEISVSEPNNWRVISGFGIFYFQTNNYIGALEQFRKLSVMSPNNDLGVRNMAAAYYALDDIDNAIKFTREAIEINPSDVAFSNLGTMLFYVKKYKEAIVAYKKAVELRETNYIYWGNLADAYKLIDDQRNVKTYLVAADLALEALELNPNDVSLKADIAYYYANTDRVETAVMYAKQISNNNSATDNFMVATAYDVMKDTDMALFHLEIAIEKKYPVEEIMNTPLLSHVKKDDRYTTILENLDN